MSKQEKQKKRAIGSKDKPKVGSSEDKSWFLGIGINNYKHFPHLNNAVKDVEDLKTLE